jgi:hypothetical protein
MQRNKVNPKKTMLCDFSYAKKKTKFFRFRLGQLGLLRALAFYASHPQAPLPPFEGIFALGR